MHIIIMGCGRVGSSLAILLEKRGHDVSVIDIDDNSFRRLGPTLKGAQSKASDSTVLYSKKLEFEKLMDSPLFPAATIPTSCLPEWFARNSASTTSSPASTTRAGLKSMSVLGSPR